MCACPVPVLVWVIAGTVARVENLRQVMLPVYNALKAELPAGRVAKVLFNAVDLEKVDELNLAYGGVDLETGERTTLAGKRSEKKEIKEFVGVSVVYDKIRKERLVRTQIAGAGKEG